VGAAGAAWYAADSLRHRRESGHGYSLRGEVDVREASFLRAAESVTGAPVSYGNDAELLINGDEIFPAYLAAIREAEETVNLLTYAYWRGDIAIEVAETTRSRWASRASASPAGSTTCSSATSNPPSGSSPAHGQTGRSPSAPASGSPSTRGASCDAPVGPSSVESPRPRSR